MKLVNIIPLLLPTIFLSVCFHVNGFSTCKEYFDYEDACPDAVDYEDLDEVCCNDTRPDKLHCTSQNGEKNYGCLPITIIPAGYGMALERSDGKLKKELVPCNNDYYEDHDRSSHLVRYPHCTKRTSSCSEIGQVMICHGGGKQKNLCGCADGYEPKSKNCMKPFDNINYPCSCLRMQCPNGTARNMSSMDQGNCPPSQRLDYDCYVNDSSNTTTNTTTSNTSGDTSSNNLLWPLLLVLLIRIVIIVVL